MRAPRATTSHGTVEGTAHDGYERFAGIPFAAPPVGPNRFRPPAPPSPFDEVFLATAFAPHAPQTGSVTEQFLSEGVPVTVSEHACLALNVWTPHCDDERRPVLFFVHGGSFLTGSSSSSLYSGASFAQLHDVVVVSCNYRLGALGFANVAALGGEEFKGSGSVGIQDVAAALRWVRDNVAAFGGDPTNVTVFGESAGAMSAATLPALRGATDLFHKLILESGAASTIVSADASAAHFDEFWGLLGRPTSIEALQSVPVEVILRAQETIVSTHQREGLVFRPVVDGEVLDVAPLDAVKLGRAREIPLLVGTNLDEWRLFSAAEPELQVLDDRSLAAAIAGWYDRDPGPAIATYRKRLGEAPAKFIYDCFGTDSAFRIPAIALAEAQYGAGGRASMYLFSWRSPAFGGSLGSFHGLELPFVFNTLETQSATLMSGDAAPRELAQTMHATWAAFARDGDPGTGPLGDWPVYEPGARTTMVLDESPHLEDDPLGEERLLWER